MDPETKRVLEQLDEVTKDLEMEGPIELDPAYLRLIERVEALPENQDGSDKSWVWRCLEMDRLHFEKARRK